MEEEKLINLVQTHSCLYDMSSRFYTDKTMKANAWDSISRELGYTASECQKHWTKLRDNYRKSLKSRNERCGATGGKRRPIKFEKQMEFVKPFILQPENPTATNLDSSSEETQNVDLPSPPPRPSSQCSSYSRSQPKTSEILDRYLFSKEREEKHPIDIFFSSMAATVKSLPPLLQVQVKRKVIEIVTEAEIKHYDDIANAANEYVPTILNARTQTQTNNTYTFYTNSDGTLSNNFTNHAFIHGPIKTEESTSPHFQ